jgi:hypothetical protein
MTLSYWNPRKILSYGFKTLANCVPGPELLYPDRDPNLKWIGTVCHLVPYRTFLSGNAVLCLKDEY